MERGVARLPDGSITVTLAPNERDLLASLPDQLRTLMGAGIDDSGLSPDTIALVRNRLFPPASSDEAVEAAYRDVVGESLLAERLERLDTFAASLAGGEEHGGSWRVVIEADTCEAWLASLHDARLTIATLVGIEDESDWERMPDPDDAPLLILHWLGWLTEEVVNVLMGTLDDD